MRVPPWLDRLATRASKMRWLRLLYVFLLAALVPVLLGRRAPPQRAVEVSYAAFMQLAARESGRISGLRLSLARYGFLLDGAPAFTRPVRAPSDLQPF